MYRQMMSALSLLIVLTMAVVAQAQTSGEQTKGWGARRALSTGNNTRVSTTESAESDNSIQAAFGGGITDIIDRERDARRKALAGAWRVHIAASDSGLAPFNAFHTFTEDGGFVETSDLLVTGTEGPAHGVWTGEKPDFQLTFELFAFDPEKKEAVGIIRVRNAITLSQDNNSFSGRYAVDFIAPDGTVEAGIDTGGYTATRIKVLPVK